MLTIDSEFQALIPALATDERDALEASILAEGCRDAIVVWHHDGSDIIVDGHNRYAICTAHGLPYNVVTRDFSSRSDVMLWMIRNQLARRNLTPFKRTELALQMEAVIRKQAEQNQGTRTDLPQNSAESLKPIETRQEVGRIAEVSHDTVRKVKKVLEAAPAPIVDKARAGDISIHAAERMTKALRGQPDDVIDLALRLADDSADKVAILARLYKSNGKDGSNATFDEIATNGGFHYGDEMDEWCDFAASSARQIDKALTDLAMYHRKIERQAKIAKSPELPGGLYNVVYADPPWAYDSSGFNQSANYIYPTMQATQIAEMPIADRVADDAVLFLWITSPLLPEAFQVIESWGFDYKASIVWHKDKAPTMGWWVRTFHEILLIGSRGSFQPAYKPESVFHAPTQGHSRKPDDVYEMIERMYPGGRYLELFARQNRDGWQSFGNEVNG